MGRVCSKSYDICIVVNSSCCLCVAIVKHTKHSLRLSCVFHIIAFRHSSSELICVYIRHLQMFLN
jgi:hypothetical protein